MNSPTAITVPTPNEIYINGCKVTMHYAQEENASAIEEIKAILLSNIIAKKS